MSANEPPVEDTEVVVLGEDPNGKLQVLQLASGGSILLEANKISVAGEDDVQIAEEQLDTAVSATDVALLMYGDRALQTLAQDELRMRLFGPDAGGTLQQVIAEELGTAVADTDVGILTYASRALNSRSLDEFVSRVTDSTGTQIDPLNQDPLSSVGNDELRNRILGTDAGGVLQEVNAEQFNTVLGATDVGVATYVARALQDIAQDEIRSRIHDSTGTQIDPLTQAILQSVANDEARVRIFQPDAGGTLQQVIAEQLDTGVANTDVGLVTYLSRALNSRSLDEFVSRVTDSTGTQIDPLNQDALQTVANDELRNRLFGLDAGGVLQEANAEQFDTILGTTDVGIATYVARALQDIAQDELRSRIHDSTGTQIDPATTALEAALKSNDTDEFIARITGADGVEIAEEQLDTAVAATDVGILTWVARALGSIAQDELRVSHPEAGVLTDSSALSGATNAVSLDLGDVIKDFDVVFDLSAVNGDAVIEVSTSGAFGGEEHEHTRIAQADLSTGDNFEQFDTSYQHVRAFYTGNDADVTEIEISAKGVS